MRKWAHLALAAFIILPSAFAQETDFEADEKDEPARKRPSFFHRPAKKSTHEQLAYAGNLEKAGKLRKAARQYRALVHRWHNAPEALVAQLAFAELLEARRKYVAAFNEYQYVIDNFSGGYSYEDILGRQFRIANHVMTARQGGFLFFPGVRSPERAMPLFQALVANAPEWKKTPEALFSLGVIYEKTKDYDSSVATFRGIQLRHPGSPLAARASFRRVYGLYMSARTNPRDERASRTALSALSAFLRDHPGSEHRGDVKEYLEELKESLARIYYERAVFYDRQRRRSRAALTA